MKEVLRELAAKHAMTSLITVLDRPVESLECRIGFLGEFSSGKSTLINAMIGAAVLPAMTKPTSKSIVEVQPRKGMTEIGYYRVDDGALTEIAPSLFHEIALGEKDGSAALVVPENNMLQEGFNLVDTPGFTALDKADADIAFGVLPQLDGIVICVSISKGIMPNTVLTFIAKPHVMALLERMVIAVTYGATKRNDEKAISNIRKAIVKQVNEICKRAGMNDIVVPVVVVDGVDGLADHNAGWLPEFVSTVKKSVYDHKRAIQRSREALNLKNVVGAALAILQERLKMVTYSTSEMDADEQETEKAMKGIESEIRELEERMDKLESKIVSVIEHIVLQSKSQFRGATSETATDMFASMVDQINVAVLALVAKDLDGFVMPSILHWSAGLSDSISSIENKVGLGKTVGTAVFVAVTAAASGGATTVAGAAEAGVAGTGIRAGVRESAKVGGEIVAKQVGMSILKTGLQVLGDVVKAINPADILGDAAESYLKKRTIDDMAVQLPRCIANQVIAAVRDEYESQRIQPAKDRIKDHRESLAAVRAKKMAYMTNQDVIIQDLQSDIKLLGTLA